MQSNEKSRSACGGKPSFRLFCRADEPTSGERWGDQLKLNSSWFIPLKKLKYSSIADDVQRWLATRALGFGDLTTRMPGSTFQHFGQRKLFRCHLQLFANGLANHI